jgi:hypothetical protein
MREIGVLFGGNTQYTLNNWRGTNAAIRTPQEIEGAAMTESEKLNASSEPDVFPQNAAGLARFLLQPRPIRHVFSERGNHGLPFFAN